MSGGFFRSTSIVGAFTLISRVTGLLRDMVYSRMFGAGLLMDAFLVAFKIPNFMRRLFAEGAFSQAFVPVVSEYKVQREHDEVRELIDGAMGTMAWFLSVLTIVGVVAAPVLVMLFAPGFRADGDRFDLTVDMLRWTFPYILFVSLAALAGGVLNSYGKFAVPATTSTLMNVVMIVFAAFIAPHFAQPGIALAIGVFVSGLVQLGFQLPFMLKLGLLRRPRWNWGHEGVRKIGRLMLPAIFGSSVSQVALLLDTLIASFLATGQHRVALLRRPPGRVSARRVQHRAGHRDPAGARGAPRGAVARAFRLDARLGGEAHHHRRAARDGGAAAAGGPAHRRHLPLRQVRRAGRAHVDAGADGVLERPDGLQHGEGAGARLLRAAGHEDARQDRRAVARAQHGPQPGRGAAARAHVSRTGPACTRCWRSIPVSAPGSTRRCCTAACARQHVLRHSTGWRRTLWQVLAGNVAMGLFLWFVAGDTQRWLDMNAWHRVGWMGVLVVGGAGIYFGVLYVLGMRVRDLRHQKIDMLPPPVDTAT